MALTVIGATTFIFLEESISVSDRAEAENIDISTIQYDFPLHGESENIGIPSIYGGELDFTISNLPKIGETAEIKMNYTQGNNIVLQVLADQYAIDGVPEQFYRSISISDNFEFVGQDNVITSEFENRIYQIIRSPIDTSNPNENISLSATIRAVSEGMGNIAGGGAITSTYIQVHVGENETLLKEDYLNLHPEMRPQRTPPQQEQIELCYGQPCPPLDGLPFGGNGTTTITPSTEEGYRTFLKDVMKMSDEEIEELVQKEYPDPDDSNPSIERFSSELETFGSSGPGIAHTYPHYNIDMPKYVTVGDAFDININYSFVEIDEDDGSIDTRIQDNGPNVYLDDVHSGVKLITYFPEEFELQNKDDLDFISYSVGRDSEWDRHTTFSTIGLFYNLEGPKTITYSFILNSTVNYPNNEFQMALDVILDKYYLNQISPDRYEISKTLVVPNFGPEGEPQPPYPGRITSSYPPISIGNDSTNTPSVDSIESLILLAEADEIDEIVEDFGFETIEEFYYSIFSSELVDEFLEKYPQYSNANFILPTLNWILPEAYGQSFQQFIVQGQVLIENDSGDFVVPEGEFEVCAYDKNLLLPNEDPTPLTEYNSNDEACDDLNSRGYFLMRVSPTDPDNDGTTPDIMVGLPLKNSGVLMFDNLNMPEETIIYSEPRENVSSILVNFVSDERIDIDNENFLKSYKVFGTINETLETFHDLGFRTNTQLQVLYDPITTTEFRLMYQSNLISLTDYYHPTNGEFIRSIVDHPVAISHEVGHFIQDKTYKNVKGDQGRVPSCAGIIGTHGDHITTNPQCAWSEGWATFVGLLTSDSSEHTTFVTNDAINSESGTNNGVKFPTRNGYSVEGWVTAALWDIHDIVDERSSRSSYDRIDGQTQNLWNAFSTDTAPSGPNYIAKNMNEFKDDWNALGYTSLIPLFNLNHLTGPITPPTTDVVIFSDEFNSFTNWTLTGDDEDWELVSDTTGYVASSDDCDRNCYMESITIDASQAVTLGFDRYIDTGVDRNEGLKVSVSTDDGASYTQLAFYSQNNNKDDSIWHTETLDISSYQSSTFKLKFTGVSSYYDDIVKIDNVTITGSSESTTTTSSSPFDENFDDLTNWSKSGDNRWNVVSSWYEDLPPNGGNFISSKNCDNSCMLTSDTIDLSSYSSATLEVSRFVDSSLDGGEYLSIEVYNGNTWTEIAKWGADNNEDTDEWEDESINITRYLDDNFKIKITSLQSSSSEDTGLDYIRIAN